jgi:long-chain acyl-CoA synthetase
MAIGWLIERMAQARDTTAVVWQGTSVSYGELIDRIARWREALDDAGIAEGQVVSIEGDYSPGAISLLLALIARNAIVVPLTASVAVHREEFLSIAEVQTVVSFDAGDGWQIERRSIPVTNELTRTLIARGHPGLVLFSSGSTGKSKAALHDFVPLLEKFKTPRHRQVTLTFLLLDHIGGINTLFYTLSNGGTAVSVRSRDPDEVCAAIERYRVELLPTSPTFLNLILMSEAYRRYDLSSLKLITYGTEVMPEMTLLRVREAFPGVRLQQTYGLSELGILRSKSRDDGSLWVKVGGEGFETKVVDGILFVRAKSAMLGYLNAPSPFDEEGWMNTQDMVEVDGEYIRILGRRTEIINVGGQKVYPAEVESVIMQMPNVRDATVYGEKNPITGQMVAARVNLIEPEDLDSLKKRVRSWCRERLEPFKVPVKITIAGGDQFSARFKKMRRA